MLVLTRKKIYVAFIADGDPRLVLRHGEDIQV